MKRLTLLFLLALAMQAQTISWSQNGTTFTAKDIDMGFLGGLSVAKSAISVCTPDPTASIKNLALTVYYSDGDNVGYGTFLMPYMGNQNGQTCFSSMFRFTAGQIISAMVAPSPVMMSPQQNGGNQ